MIYFLSAVPNYVSGTITCPVPPDDPPAEAKMIVSPDQPITMCPGDKAVYDSLDFVFQKGYSKKEGGGIANFFIKIKTFACPK